MSHWNITPQAKSYDTLPGHIIVAVEQPGFALNYPLYVEHLDKKTSTLDRFPNPLLSAHSPNEFEFGLFSNTSTKKIYLKISKTPRGLSYDLLNDLCKRSKTKFSNFHQNGYLIIETF